MRSIWSGAISFGLIFIPVKLYSASEAQELNFDMLRRGDLCRIRYARVCRETGEEVPFEDIVKGYEYKKGDYVVVEDEDFERAAGPKSKTIDIVAFIDEDEVEAKYLEKPYYLEPVKEAKNAYALLREALRRSNKVGLARFVLRTRERMAIVKAEGDVLLLDQIRFASELRTPEGLALPTGTEVPERELDMAIKLVDALTEPFKPDQYRDEYTDKLKTLIEEKAQGREPAPEPEPGVPIEVTDLFAKLRQSLEAAQKNPPASPPKKK